MEKIIFGNFKDVIEKRGNNWVIGHFMNHGTPLYNTDFEVKWGDHKKGESKENLGVNVQAKTLAILVSGKVSLKFPSHDKEFIFENRGDFVFYDKGVPHSWSILEDSLVLTIRWPSISGDQKTK